MRPQAKKNVREMQVGMLVLTGILIAAAFSFRLTESPLFRRGTELQVYLKDATGIFLKSKVKMAGIDIGYIKEIELEDGQARLTLVITEKIEIPRGSQALPRPLGILGDKYIEISVPLELQKNINTGTKKDSAWLNSLWMKEAVAQEVGPPKQMYRSGETLESKNSAATLDDVTRQMGIVGENLKSISHDLKVLVESNDDAMGSSIQSLNRILSKLDKAFANLDEKKLQKNIEDLGKSLESVNESIGRVKSITRKIDEGEGTVGALINDRETVDRLNQTLVSLNSFLDRAQRTELRISISSEYLPSPKATKSYLGLSIRPREDYGYLAQVVYDQQGVTKRSTVTKVTNGGPPQVVETTEVDENDFKFSLQFAKRLEAFSGRIGIFESTGGAAFDVHFLQDRLVFSTEVFEFNRVNTPAYLKTYLTFNFLDYFYLNMGGADLLSKKGDLGQRTFFVGFGISFADSDLKTLAILPSSLP